jgi:dTDP-4-amino-4,6-dideoxygalactose transaminase
MKVPFFRAAIGEEEIAEVTEVLRSGWLTTGPLTRQFEHDLAAAVGAKHAVAVNSCTAALHLAVEALGLKMGEAVLVPAMTFAATAEVVRYCGAVPILVDCEPGSLNLSLADAEAKMDDLAAGRFAPAISADLRPVGIMPVHVGGAMLDVGALRRFAESRGLWVVEDAAHSLPAAWRPGPDGAWQRCGEATSNVTCFSFYANKTITTGEGGMAVTDDPDLADRMRLMSLHGLSHDAWERYRGGSWDYRIVAPGFKYNLTDVASAIGVHQLRKAEGMRSRRETIADRYFHDLGGVAELELPEQPRDRLHSWHLFPIALRLERLTVDRDHFKRGLAEAGVGTGVHWRPLHLHEYYRDEFGWKPEYLPIATREWSRRISLPIFPTMSEEERRHVVTAVKSLCALHGKA